MLSMGQPHRAVPVTGATCLAVAVRVEGSLPNRLARVGEGPIAIAHPSGVTLVDAAVEHSGDPSRAYALYGALYRTTRRLFEGHVLYRTPAAGASVRRTGTQ
jgi:2-methylaconitate cis-trans-isomerase PrpF